MKIIKYKKEKNNQYIVILENNIKIKLYEEVIIKYKLLIQKEIHELDEILRENKIYECYYSAIRFLNTKKRSKNEIKLKLQSLGFEKDEIEKTIIKIIKQNYINDRDYAISFVKEKILLTIHGPNRIKNDLRKKGIEEDIINMAMEQYDLNIQNEKINKLINKIIKMNQNKGTIYLKRKIYNNLEYQGFNKENIDEIIKTKTFTENKNAKEKEEERLRKKYINKYNGIKLEYKIKAELKRKGLLFKDEEI